MITKNDCILLLTMLPQTNETSLMLKLALRNPDVDLRVLKYINSNRQLDANAFYEKFDLHIIKERNQCYIKTL